MHFLKKKDDKEKQPCDSRPLSYFFRFCQHHLIVIIRKKGEDSLLRAELFYLARAPFVPMRSYSWPSYL